jgi:3-hydroxyisobutyrate dehydrogenase-like beta-hydroxyacid dehydrogenase
MRSVGIIGLGIMGGAFAKNLAAEGWQVMGYDIDAGRARTLARAGVEIAADVGELASRAPTIILSLPDRAAPPKPSRRSLRRARRRGLWSR